MDQKMLYAQCYINGKWVDGEGALKEVRSPIDGEVIGTFKEASPNQVNLAVKCAIELINTGRLREDLYYRLNVFPIPVPPLRLRREDIVPLLQHKLRKLNELQQTHKLLKPKTLDALVNYDWPGNVRELENILERIVITSETYEIGPESLPDYIFSLKSRNGGELVSISRACTLAEAKAELEKQLLEKARV